MYLEINEFICLDNYMYMYNVHVTKWLRVVWQSTSKALIIHVHVCISFQQPSHFTLQQQATSQTGLTVGITQPNSTAGTSVLGGGGLTGLGRGTIGGVQNLGTKPSTCTCTCIWVTHAI